MVQSMNSQSPKNWKSILAIVVAGGGLLWHVLACNESPMSFSPDGKNLVFTTIDTMEAKGEDGKKHETVLSRLMVLSQQKELKTIEECKDCILTGPAYSPDGKSFCYLKIPMLSEEENKAVGEKIKQRAEQHDDLKMKSSQSPRDFSDFIKGVPQIKAFGTDQSLPPAGLTFEYMNIISISPRIPAILIIRDSQTYEITKQGIVNLVVSRDPNSNFYFGYLSCRLQYSPDSQWIYIPANMVIQAVDTETLESRLIGGPAPVRIAEHDFVTIGALSPDGKTYATLLIQDKKPVLAFYQTDGEAARYRRLDFEVSMSTLAWKDNNTLVLLGSSEKGEEEFQGKLIFVDKTKLDITTSSRLFPIFADNKNKNISELLVMGETSVSPDGNTMIVCSENGVLFLNTQGDVLHHYTCPGEERLVCPTFSHDGKQIAFKKVTEGKSSGIKSTQSIVFLTLQGEAGAEIVIPPAAANPKSENTEPVK